MESKSKIFIGIDPDTDKNGVAMKVNKEFLLYNFDFFSLYELLKNLKENQRFFDSEIKVYVECGFLNKGNRHKQVDKSLEFNGKISERVGANHEIAKKICEMCDSLNLDYEQVRPTRSKINSIDFKELTGYEKRSNQEQRDALMLIWEL
jgi:hypothetical protein